VCLLHYHHFGSKSLKYNHAVSVNLEILSNQEDGDDITAEMLERALLKKIKTIQEDFVHDNYEIYDTFLIEVVPFKVSKSKQKTHNTFTLST